MPKTAKPTKNAKPAKATPSRTVAEAHALQGKTAPTFTLPDATGKPVALKELTARGNVVLYFYPRDMTPGCTTEACGFRDSFAAVKAAGAQVVGVSPDSSASHQKFIGKYDLNFTLLADPDNRIAKAYGVYKQKSLYGREYMGIERTTFIIDRAGKIHKIFPKVKVNGHTDEVLAALRDL